MLGDDLRVEHVNAQPLRSRMIACSRIGGAEAAPNANPAARSPHPIPAALNPTAGEFEPFPLATHGFFHTAGSAGTSLPALLTTKSKPVMIQSASGSS